MRSLEAFEWPLVSGGQQPGRLTAAAPKTQGVTRVATALRLRIDSYREPVPSSSNKGFYPYDTRALMLSR